MAGRVARASGGELGNGPAARLEQVPAQAARLGHVQGLGLAEHCVEHQDLLARIAQVESRLADPSAGRDRLHRESAVPDFEQELLGPGTVIGWAPDLDPDSPLAPKLAGITTGGHSYVYRLRETGDGTEVRQVMTGPGSRTRTLRRSARS
jgi:hypothetical protein